MNEMECCNVANEDTRKLSLEKAEGRRQKACSETVVQSSRALYGMIASVFEPNCRGPQLRIIVA